ncbi:NAD-dependent epimerase/dehydratase family protein [Streptomyces canarius]
MIAVTGATGNIGRVLVELLAGAGEEVVAVSRRPGSAPPAAGVRWVLGGWGRGRHAGRPRRCPRRVPRPGGRAELPGESPTPCSMRSRTPGAKRIVPRPSGSDGCRPERS